MLNPYDVWFAESSRDEGGRVYAESHGQAAETYVTNLLNKGGGGFGTYAVAVVRSDDATQPRRVKVVVEWSTSATEE